MARLYTVRSARFARSGYVLVTMIASLVVVFAFVGLAVDVGVLQYTKSRMQTAADAAALGGVQEFKRSGAGSVVAAGKRDAALNGFRDLAETVTVSVNHPPATGFYTADPTAVEVGITKDVPAYFMQVLGFTSTRVRARAVARQGPGTTCVHILDPAASGALSASGGVLVQVNCGVVVNSNNAAAAKASGGSTVVATAFEIVGGYSASGGGVFTPHPKTSVAPSGDPLSYLGAPSVGACTVSDYHATSGATATLDPGVYCNGITISGGSTIRLNPGTYVLKGGGLTVSGGSSLTGSGVTFYNTAAPSYAYAGISISGGTVIRLTAPTGGSLAGILFFQDRSIASGGASTISGNATTVYNGSMYFPTTAVTYSGGSFATGAYTVIVAKTLSFSGGSILNNDYSTLPGGSPIKGNGVISE